jgi:hypothetical protein
VDRLACSFAKHASFPACQPSPAQPTSAPGRARRSALQLRNKALVTGDWTPWKERVGCGSNSGSAIALCYPATLVHRPQILNTISGASTDRPHRSIEPHLGAHRDGLVSSRLVLSLVQGDCDRCALSVLNSIAATVRSRKATSTGDAARPLRSEE